MLISTYKLAAEFEYHNPDPLVQLLCHANESMLVVEGVEMIALVDTGSHISALTEGFLQKWG